MTRRKLLILLLLGAAILAIVLLAAGLAEVQLPAGQPFTLGRAEQLTPPPAGAPAELSPAARVLLRVWLILTLALLPFSIFYLLISPEARRRVVRNLVVLGVFMLIMSSVGQGLRVLGEGGLLGGLGALGLAEGSATGAPAEFSASAPGWLTALLSFIVAAVVVALAAGGVLAFARNRRQTQAALPLAAIAEEAETALAALAGGGDLRDTVLRCYAEMSRLVREGRGIQRQQTMTAREFEEQLARAGLPADSVHDLTRIFEAVRYGAKDPGPGAEARAVACLAAIAAACRSEQRSWTSPQRHKGTKKP